MVVTPTRSCPVSETVIVPKPVRLFILLTLISDAIWVHFPPLVLVIYGVDDLSAINFAFQEFFDRICPCKLVQIALTSVGSPDKSVSTKLSD